MQEQSNLIKKVFLEEVIPECALGNLSIDAWHPAISFNTKIVEKNIVYKDPKNDNQKSLLIITNINDFLNTLIKYVNKAIEFYFDGDFSYKNVKTVTSLVFANASASDLLDPVSFLNRQTIFISWEPKDNFYIDFLGYKAKIIIKKNKALLESPYSFEVEIKDEKESFTLPSVLFGINDDEAYVYAVQNKDKSSSKLKKKINRALYKINEGYVRDNLESKKLNTNDVTMSFVAAITVFISYLKELNISKLNVSILLPIRYQGHQESCQRRIDYYRETLPDEEFFKKYKSLLESEERYKENVTFKLYRTFKRILNQGNILKLRDVSDNVMDGLKLEINDGYFYNNMMTLIYDAIAKKK